MQVQAQAVDIRKVRTRKAIMDSFLDLLQKRSFHSIRIRDITSLAMMNRATFYHHFADKYELLEVITRETLMENLQHELPENTAFSHGMMKKIFLSLAHFHEGLSNMCKRSYEEMIINSEAILREEVKLVLIQSLRETYREESQESLQIMASMLTWALYGAAYEWKTTSHLSAEEYFEQVKVSIESLAH